TIDLSSVITVQLQTASSVAVNAGVGGVVVNLSSSATATGKFWNIAGTTTITSVTIPAGQSSASFRYADTTLGSPVITAAASGLTSGTQTETVANTCSNNKVNAVLQGESKGDPM